MSDPSKSRTNSKYWPALLAALILGGCELPSLESRMPSRAVSPEQTASTQLGTMLARDTAAHPGLSGVLPLDDPHQAFAARMLLAQSAERTLDVQYYIWQKNITGTLLLHSLYQAAERGVRVRLLLDDNGTSGLDDTLALLDAHPRIEVRLFNPFSVRSPKAIGFVTHFSRANRRMHNKSFTADNQATIVGGRNIGDAYFGASEGVLFADLDVLAAGAVVPDVSADFDRYWNSDSSYPVAGLLPPPGPDATSRLADMAARAERDPRARDYLQALRQSDGIGRMLSGQSAVRWSPVALISDDPRKGLGQATDEQLMIFRMSELLGAPATHLELVSPYFVPTAAGVEVFSKLVADGVRVRILTNALESTDVAAVHAGYAKRRKALLEAGVELYELRRQHDGAPEDRAGPFGSSASSLHAKTFAVDGRRVFVGSFNFDPRSARLNTELGLVIDDEVLASHIEAAFDGGIPDASYEVRLDERGRLYWLEHRQAEQVRHDREPGAGLLKRAGIRLLALLPIDWLL